MKRAMETFNAQASTIAHLLEAQEQLALVSGEQAAKQRQMKRGQLDLLLFDLERFSATQGPLPHTDSIISALRLRKSNLLSGPQWHIIKQAQQLLAFPNLVFLAYEETPVRELEIPEIARLVIIDRMGTLLFDHPLPSDPLHALVGNDGQLQYQDQAQVWSELLSVVTGRYVICHNLFLLQIKVIDSAKCLGLEPPILVGQSLFHLLLQYFDKRNYDTESDLDEPSEEELVIMYEQLERTRQKQPYTTALEQATKQFHLLQAMAQGVINASCLSHPLRRHESSFNKERKHL